LHRASGKAVVTLSGQDRYLGPHGSEESVERYLAEVAAWRARGRRPIVAAPPEPAPLTVRELATQYEAWAESYYVAPAEPGAEPVPRAAALANIRRLLAPLVALFGHEPAAAFGPVKLMAVRETFVADGLSRDTANRHTAGVRRLFKWAAARELAPASVWHALATVEGLRRGRSVARETEPVRPVSDAAVDATLPHLSSVVRAMIQLQRISGARPAEICLLRPCDVDTSSVVWAYRPRHHKTAHCGLERTVYFGPRAQAVLRPFLSRATTAYCFSPAEADAERRSARTAARRTPERQGNRVGSNRKATPKRRPHERYDVSSYRRAIARACDRAGVERWAPNRLRHSAATEIRREFGVEGAQVILGHARADVTQVYAARDEALGAKIALRLG